MLQNTKESIIKILIKKAKQAENLVEAEMIINQIVEISKTEVESEVA